MASPGPPSGPPLSKTELRQAEKDLKTAVRTRSDQDLPWRTVLAFVLRLGLQHPFALLLILLMVALLSAAEFLSVGLLFPLIDRLMGIEDGAFLAATPFSFLGRFFDGLSSIETVRLLAVLLIALEIVKAVLAYIATRTAQWIDIRVNRDMRLMIFDDIMSAGMGFINRERTANLFTVLHSFPSGASAIMGQMIIAMQNFGSFAALVILAVLMSWKLSLFIGVLSLLAVAAVVGLTNVVRRLAKDIRQARLELHSATLDTLQGLKIVHQFGRRPAARKRFLTRLDSFQASQFRASAFSALVQPAYSVIMVSLVAAVLVGATLVLDTSSDVWLGVLFGFITISMRFMSRTGKYAKRRTEIAKHIPEVEAMMAFLSRTDKQRMRDGARPFDQVHDRIRFDRVSFRYATTEPEVLHGVSFDIPRGKTVALVGASGAGKSTVVDLVGRLYDPTGGRILIDGHELRDHRLDDWRRRVATVSQNTFLFNDTVRANLAFARPEASEADIMDAARQANAHDFIMELPEGYDTIVGDRGVRLSGGQAQRLAIARAILADPELLVLDEATSALDTATEHQVQTAIERVSRDRTILVIAHRLSTVRNADQIVVLEKGRVVESGRHDELLARRGAYARYVQMQDVVGGGGPSVVPAPTEHDLVIDDEPDEILALQAEELLFALPLAPAAAPSTEEVPGGRPQRFLFGLDGPAQVALAAVGRLAHVVSARAVNGTLEVALRDDPAAVPSVFAAVAAEGLRVTSLAPLKGGN